MLERDVEKGGNKYAKSKGWLTYKFTSPARRNVPDQIYIPPEGHIIFIEMKATGKKATPAQLREHEKLRDNGCIVLVLDSIESIKFLIDIW